MYAADARMSVYQPLRNADETCCGRQQKDDDCTFETFGVVLSETVVPIADIFPIQFDVPYNQCEQQNGRDCVQRCPCCAADSAERLAVQTLQ